MIGISLEVPTMSIPGLSLGPVNVFQTTNMPMGFLGGPASAEE